MRVLIELSETTINKIQKLADKEVRSRKQMIELIIIKSLKK